MSRWWTLEVELGWRARKVEASELPKPYCGEPLHSRNGRHHIVNFPSRPSDRHSEDDVATSRSKCRSESDARESSMESSAKPTSLKSMEQATETRIADEPEIEC